MMFRVDLSGFVIYGKNGCPLLDAWVCLFLVVLDERNKPLLEDLFLFAAGLLPDVNHAPVVVHAPNRISRHLVEKRGKFLKFLQRWRVAFLSLGPRLMASRTSFAFINAVLSFASRRRSNSLDAMCGTHVLLNRPST